MDKMKINWSQNKYVLTLLSRNKHPIWKISYQTFIHRCFHIVSASWYNWYCLTYVAVWGHITNQYWCLRLKVLSFLALVPRGLGFGSVCLHSPRPWLKESPSGTSHSLGRGPRNRRAGLHLSVIAWIVPTYNLLAKVSHRVTPKVNSAHLFARKERWAITIKNVIHHECILNNLVTMGNTPITFERISRSHPVSC